MHSCATSGCSESYQTPSLSCGTGCGHARLLYGVVLSSRLGDIWRTWSVCWVRRSRWRGFPSVCLARLLVLERSKCALRRAASVFLFPLVGSFFALSFWRKMSRVILATSCEVSCCSLDAFVCLDGGIL